MISRENPAWPEMKRAIDKRIEELRDELEKGATEPEDLIRGRITELRKIKEDVEPTVIEMPAPTYS